MLFLNVRSSLSSGTPVPTKRLLLLLPPCLLVLFLSPCLFLNLWSSHQHLLAHLFSLLSHSSKWLLLHFPPCVSQIPPHVICLWSALFPLWSQVGTSCLVWEISLHHIFCWFLLGQIRSSLFFFWKFRSFLVYLMFATKTYTFIRTPWLYSVSRSNSVGKLKEYLQSSVMKDLGFLKYFFGAWGSYFNWNFCMSKEVYSWCHSDGTPQWCNAHTLLELNVKYCYSEANLVCYSSIYTSCLHLSIQYPLTLTPLTDVSWVMTAP